MPCRLCLAQFPLRKSTILYAAGGAALSAAVALTCAIASPIKTDLGHDMAAIEGAITVARPPWLAESRYTTGPFRPSRAAGFGVQRIGLTPGQPQSTVGKVRLHMQPVAFEISAGWPFYCLQAELMHPALHTDETNTEWWVQMGVSLTDGQPVSTYLAQPCKVIPMRPAPIGLLANAGIYALFIWFVTLGPVRARRRFRQSRGRCGACGYNIQWSSGASCPECGQSVPPATQPFTGTVRDERH